MKKVLLAAFAAVLIMFTSCKSGGDPKAVLSEFFTKLGKKDLEGARKLATTDSKQMLDLMEMGMKSADTKDFDKFAEGKMEYGEAKIDGDKATVPVKELSNGETTNYILKKEGGAWKVAFDKATMMEIGTQKMNEGGVNMSDSIANAIDQIKQMDTDSLADALKEGSKAMDSAAKELEKLNN